MKKTKDGRRRFSREFKVAAVRRVMGGESRTRVARELDIGVELLWRWENRVARKGEQHLHGIGERESDGIGARAETESRQRIADLERLVGQQQMEIRFLGKALRRVEELRQEKNDDGAAASSKR